MADLKTGAVLVAFIGLFCILGSKGVVAYRDDNDDQQPVEYYPSSASPDAETEQPPIVNSPSHPPEEPYMQSVNPKQGPYAQQSGTYEGFYMQQAGPYRGPYMQQRRPYGGPYKQQAGHYGGPYTQQVGPYEGPYMQQTGPYVNPYMGHIFYENYLAPVLPVSNGVNIQPARQYGLKKDVTLSESNQIDSYNWLSFFNPQAFNNVKLKVGK